MTAPSQNGVAEAVATAVANGILVRTTAGAWQHAPFTYWPSPVPRAAYIKALTLAPILSELITKVADDREWLSDAVADASRADPFTARLKELTMAYTHRKPVGLIICRFDYFVQEKQLRMVEMNTVAASFAALGAKATKLHRHCAQHPESRSDYRHQGVKKDMLAECNHPHVQIAQAIADAHSTYVRKVLLPQNDGSTTITVMVVQPGERNTADQDALRAVLWENHRVVMKRKTLGELALATVDDNANGASTLSLDSECISVVYYRAGYTPDDYPTETEWKARQIIESSNAVLVPTAAVQLAGAKVVQQRLGVGNTLEKFLYSEDAEMVRSTLAQMYPLDDSSVQNALEKPQNFVLKPQREGGGNNLYGEDIPSVLNDSKIDRNAFVLMDRILPDQVDNALIRNGEATPTKVVSELGIFGAHLRSDNIVLSNAVAGTLLRSKHAQTDDGGVAAGVAVLDSVCFVD